MKDYFNLRYVISPVGRSFPRESCTGGRGEDEYARLGIFKAVLRGCGNAASSKHSEGLEVNIVWTTQSQRS